MHAVTKVSLCSRILSVKHLSSLRYSRRDARHERSITKGKRWTFSNIDNVFRSWVTKRILDKRAWSCSASMYHSAVVFITRGLTWSDWACQTWCRNSRMIAEFGWWPRKMVSNSCPSLNMGCVSWRNLNTKTSGQCWTGSSSNSCTWLSNPSFSNNLRRTSNNPRQFQLTSFLLSGSGGDFKIFTLIVCCGSSEMEKRSVFFNNCKSIHSWPSALLHDWYRTSAGKVAPSVCKSNWSAVKRIRNPAISLIRKRGWSIS